jgi:3-oxoacyl-[acyl-carrier-protein] synthase III
MRAAITAIAHNVPPQVRTNAEVAVRLGVDEAWIEDRTGIRERRVLTDGGTSDLILPAAEECLRRAGGPADVDCVLVPTITPDHLTPSTAATVIRRLGLTSAWGYDLSAACSGFLYGLVTAAKLVESGAARRVLVCAADRMSCVTNPADRYTAILLGDGAGVALVEPTQDATVGLIDFLFRVDPAGECEVVIPAGGSRLPASAETVRDGKHCLFMSGPPVFRAAVAGMSAIASELLARQGLSVSDLDWFVPHQANGRILEAVADRLGVPPDRCAVNVDRYGNTSAATIPIVLSEWWQAGRLRPGSKILMCSFGAGYTIGAVYLKWAVQHGGSICRNT